MSEENVEVVRKVFDAFNRGDLDAWSGFLSPEVVWESLSLVGFRDVYRGRRRRESGSSSSSKTLRKPTSRSRR